MSENTSKPTEQTKLSAPASSQVPDAPQVYGQELLDAIAVQLPIAPHEFKAAEGKQSSLGFYGNGKVTIKGVTFQIGVTCTVVKSNTLVSAPERAALKRQLGLTR